MRIYKLELSISAGQILDAAGLQDGDHLNLLDWSPSRNLAIVLDDVVHSLNPGTSAHEIVFDYMGSSISSLSWAPDGRHLAVGMHDSLIYIWDVERKCPTRTLRNVHWRSSRVGSLAWKCDNILTSGGSDGRVVNSDPRMPSAAHVVQSYRGHGPGDICGLKWSPDHASFKQLASGGSDGLVHVWDARNQNQWAFRFKVAARDASVRALDWCPFKGCLLATGGGVGGDGKSNGSIRFWSTQTGACVRSVKTGSTRDCIFLRGSCEFISALIITFVSRFFFSFSPALKNEKRAVLSQHFAFFAFNCNWLHLPIGDGLIGLLAVVHVRLILLGFVSSGLSQMQ
ncbi:uncharacterized protein A4U43_C07F27600 [Asparagus officinalis]|uniref:Anaphase-promoting complex subunit 4-like WD40 domain-containing protein n=1 Tax=Asparagus officinalis TaxID=4686 RepID=A0A5P1EFG1_ASPOF|nr:uncharacterized protein A4U43_C07F27600 [Asparagus officinalis]